MIQHEPTRDTSPRAFAPAGASEPATAPSQTLAIVSLVLGVVALVLSAASVLGLLCAIGAIVTGVMALQRIAAGTASGKGLAIGGLVTGGIAALLSLLALLGVLFVAAQMDGGPDDAPGPGSGFGDPCVVQPGESDDAALDRCFGAG